MINERRLERFLAKELHNYARKYTQPIIESKGFVPEATWRYWDFQSNKEYEQLHPDGQMQMLTYARHIISQANEPDDLKGLDEAIQTAKGNLQAGVDVKIIGNYSDLLGYCIRFRNSNSETYK